MTSTIRDRGAHDVPLDTILKTLSHPTRRHILTRLRDHQLNHSNPLPIEDLTPTGSTDPQYYTRLYHNHLPHLDSCGFLNWKPDTETLAPGPHYDAIDPVITLLETNQDALPTSWP